MKASFTRAIRYWVTGECISPLRTGGTEHTVDQVLTTHTGLAMIQASSIAGAMNSFDPNPELFGDRDSEGTLRITDAIFSAEVMAVTRPRVRIDGATGTAAKSAKFDVACLPTGSVCQFELLWRGSVDGDSLLNENGHIKTLKMAETIEEYLSAIQVGEILFGAQKSNGFGRMRLSVKRRFYNMFDPSDRDAWLDDAEDGIDVALDQQPSNHVLFTVEAETDMTLVKASAPLKSGKEKIDSVQMEENGKSIIPGSSLKGAMRMHMQKIAPFLAVSQEQMNRLMGCGAMKKETGVAGKILFTDASLSSEKKLPKITRIRINKITGSVVRKALITERPVGGVWQWQLRIPPDESTGCLLALYALRDLGLGLYQLGGTKAIGRGTISRVQVDIEIGEKTASLLVKDGQVSLQDDDGVVARWEAQMGGIRYEN